MERFPIQAILAAWLYGPATMRETPHIFEGTLASLLDGPTGPLYPCVFLEQPHGSLRGPTGPHWAPRVPGNPMDSFQGSEDLGPCGMGLGCRETNFVMCCEIRYLEKILLSERKRVNQQ